MTSSVVRALGLFASVLGACVAGAQSTQPVEWEASEGGNGHWYQLVVANSAISWAEASSRSSVNGGHLATVTSSAEDTFVATLAADPAGWNFTAGYGPWLGGYQDPAAADYVEPAGGWRWVTGETWTWSAWGGSSYDEPNDCFCNCGPENFLHYKNRSINVVDRIWNDMQSVNLNCQQPIAFVVEWSADCNNDGIVDYGQIKSGQLADDNTNGIPDICETSITGVLPPSVPAQGGSTITINGRNFPAQPSVLVGGVTANNVVRVSDSRLTAVTPALLPGMAPLTVNGFTLPDAIYIRPECGSDLDQNGTVDAADISIILLDFGPCYEGLQASGSKDPPELLADESAQKPTQR